MPRSGNGAKPASISDEVATGPRQRPQEERGQEASEAILRDPDSVNAVTKDEGEAAGPAAFARRRSAFRRGLRLLLVSAIAACGFSILKGRLARRENSLEPL